MNNIKERLIKNNCNIINYDLSVVDLKKDLTDGNILITEESFKSNLQISEKASLKDVKIMVNGKNSLLIIEENSQLENCNIWINGDYNTVKIGRNCNLKGTYFMCCDEGNTIIVDEDTTTNGEFWGNVYFHTFEKSKIEIGKDCMFSGNIVLRTTDGHAIINSSGERINPPKDIKIDNHVWIGMNSMILKGTHIATGCIVGANSIITKKFDTPYTMIGGNPAKSIKSNIDYDWKRERGFNFTESDYRNYK